MLDPLVIFHKTLTCPFCQTKFSDVVKLIPDCGSFICGTCYDVLAERLGQSKEYNCTACDQQHVLPENGMANCKQLVGLLRNPVEKPLSEQARKLKLLVKNIEEELASLNVFDPRDYIEQHCAQLRESVSQAAESAIKHIHELESDLFNQIEAYRQRRLDSLTTQSSKSGQLQVSFNKTRMKCEVFTKEISKFIATWNDYFKRLNASASDNEVEAAINQTGIFQARIRTLDEETKNSALNDSLLHFNPEKSLYSSRDHLGELVEISAHGS